MLIWKINFCSIVLQLLRMFREIKVSSDWFGCHLVISLYIVKVFLEMQKEIVFCTVVKQ